MVMKMTPIKKGQTKPKAGASVLAWMGMTVMLLILLYIPTDLTLRVIKGQEFNGILDNAVSAAVVQIEESKVSAGEVDIDPVRAERAVYEVLALSFGLEYEEILLNGRSSFRFKPDSLAGSNYQTLPVVEFQHIPFTQQEVKAGVVKTSAPFKDGSVYKNITHDSVVICVTTVTPNFFLNQLEGMTLTRISAAQAHLAGQS